MGKILIRTADNAVFSYDKQLAQDPRFRTVEDPNTQTATVKKLVDVAQRLNPQLQPDDEAPINGPKKAVAVQIEQEEEVMERVNVLLDTLGITDVAQDICHGLDMVIEKMLNPGTVDELQAIPVIEAELEDAPEKVDEGDGEDPGFVAAPEEDDDDTNVGSIAEVEDDDVDPDAYKKITDKDELEAWAREHLSFELDKRFGMKKLREQVAAEIAKRK